MISALLLQLLLMLPLPAPQHHTVNPVAEVREVSLERNGGTVTSVITFSGDVILRSGRLSDPPRLYFDAEPCGIAKNVRRRIDADDGMVKALRLGNFRPGVVRIVFDLLTDEYDFRMISADEPRRLTVIIMPRNAPREPEEDEIL